jgi:TRAP-type C4-dicarboxylate transport system permease small subunit
MLKWMDRLTGLIGSALLFLLMIVTFIDVCGRNLFNHPLTGASEITEIFLACIIFLMLPGVAMKQLHIVIDLIDIVSTRTMRIAEEIFSAVASCSMFGLIGWQLWALGDKAVGYGDATPSLQLPLAPVFYFIAVLSFVNAIAFLIALPRAIGTPAAAPKSDSPETAEAAEKLHLPV